MATSPNTFDSGIGILAQFHSDGFSSGPPAIFIFFFVVVAVLIVGSILMSIGKGVKEWSDNNQQPVLTVTARMVAKREDVSVTSHHHNNNHHNHTTSSTTYYTTFEFASGDRKEFEVSDSQYGLLAEGDAGELTFQGTRYQGFHRSASIDAPTPAADLEAGGDETTQQNSAHSFCPHCGVVVSGAFKFCPHCGKVQPTYTANA